MITNKASHNSMLTGKMVLVLQPVNLLRMTPAKMTNGEVTLVFQAVWLC